MLKLSCKSKKCFLTYFGVNPSSETLFCTLWLGKGGGRYFLYTVVGKGGGGTFCTRSGGWETGGRFCYVPNEVLYQVVLFHCRYNQIISGN